MLNFFFFVYNNKPGQIFLTHNRPGIEPSYTLVTFIKKNRINILQKKLITL